MGTNLPLSVDRLHGERRLAQNSDTPRRKPEYIGPRSPFWTKDQRGEGRTRAEAKDGIDWTVDRTQKGVDSRTGAAEEEEVKKPRGAVWT